MLGASFGISNVRNRLSARAGIDHVTVDETEDLIPISGMTLD